MTKSKRTARLTNPFNQQKSNISDIPGVSSHATGIYEDSLRAAWNLRQKPYTTPIAAIERQHQKNRMTVWERIHFLVDGDPTILFQNWGPNLDGASLVTALAKVGGRNVAIYGHDFTVRAGSIDATNGSKLAKLFQTAGKLGFPIIGFNDSAGAYVPAGVGGLDGYAEAFRALRETSGRVPSIMCMFGFNAGGGSYLPRQGSFVIQPNQTFFGLTGPAVVKSVLGEDVTPDELGGPSVHSQTGVTDFVVEDEVQAIRKVKRLLDFLPSNNAVSPRFRQTSDPIDRKTWDVNILLRRAFNGPSGFNTPIDVTILIQQICDYGDFQEFQPDRARNTICAFGRIGGHVIGFCANNSAIASGQIDIDAALKNARFIRFCNLYNIPMLFIEDTTGFLPGCEQESRGIVHAGRAMLDSIIDLRVPRFLLIVRNAIGGAYASFNNYKIGADMVFALPTTRLAVMGPAGKEFVYKEELQTIRLEAKRRASIDDTDAIDWLKEQENRLSARYESEFMNPREALSLGSIGQIIMPQDLRQILCTNFELYIRAYKPAPMEGAQREFH